MVIVREVVTPGREADRQQVGEERDLDLRHVADIVGVVAEIARPRQRAAVEPAEPRVVGRIAVERLLNDFAGRRGRS